MRVCPSEQYDGRIVQRPWTQPTPAIERLAEQRVRYFDTERLFGQLWIVEKQRLQIRERGTSG